MLIQDNGPGHRRERIILYDHEVPFREHLTPVVKHNIVIFDYEVNYDRLFFRLLKQEPRSRTARDSRRRRLFPGYVKASNETLSFQRYSRMHVAGKASSIDLLEEEIVKL